MEKRKFLILLLSTILAAFLGSFIAGRAVAKKACVQPVFPPIVASSPDDISKEINVMMENHRKIMEKMNRDMDTMMKQASDSANYVTVNSKVSAGNYTAIKTEETPSGYRITIALSSFNNNPDNVNVEVKGNKVIISAQYKSSDKKESSSSQFYQSLVLPEKIDANSIKKHQEGNSLIIEIPKKNKK